MSSGKIDGGSVLAGAVAGGLIGLGAGYLLGRSLSKRKTEEIIDREVQAVKSYYQSKTDRTSKRDYSGAPGATPPVGNAGRIPYISLTTSSAESGPDSRIISVSGDHVDPEGEDLDDDDEEGDPSEFRDAEKIGEEQRDQKSMVYPITAEEFLDEQTTYEKISLYYFTGDDILADERHRAIPHPYEVCGAFKLGFGDDPENPHISYVRNNKLRVDFEISQQKGSYAESLHYGRPQ